MDYFVLKSVCMPSDWMRAICCSVPTEKALGMVTANDMRCVCDVPCYTSALRDGWAVRSSDNGQTRTAAAWSVENGRSHAQLEIGQAIWVNTGGTVPQGADAVIASRNSMDLQKIQSCVVPGDNIEQQGSDWKRGEVIVPAGTRVGAREMALLFEAGVKRVCATLNAELLRKTSFNVLCKPALSVRADKLELELILSNLLKNALEASNEVSHPVVIIEAFPCADQVVVRVENSGKVLSEEDFHRLKTPLLSSKATGLGLGVTIASALAEANGGQIQFKARPEGGLIAVVTLLSAASLPENASRTPTDISRKEF